MLKRLKQLTLGALALGALALGGSALAGAAATGTGTATTTTPATPPASGDTGGGPGFSAADAPGKPAHENAEKAVTGEAAEKAKAAALASVGGGTAGTVTGDFRNSGDYEVEVTKKDGSKVTVRLDSSFKVESHPGPGGPRGSAGGEPGSEQAPAVTGTGQAPSAT
ncbi:MAG TPA: hypothetical protein VGO14_03545 [Solirubrobacteraceae bacterium]|jgi:hypothetical protein|nr:hypothetical protein [Solirubrobacteraceae bacterium]